jgi:hypothetical protein
MPIRLCRIGPSVTFSVTGAPVSGLAAFTVLATLASILRNAAGGRGSVRGDLVGRGAARRRATPTTRLDLNFEIRVVRIGMNRTPR